MNLNDSVQPKGEVEQIIEYKNGEIERKVFPNTVLAKGREALASGLANDIGDEFDFYVSRMLWGDGGTNGGVPIFVTSSRTGLFGITRVNKSVVSTVDPQNLTQVVFTSVVAYTEGNGFDLNEMALQLNNGDLYSMVTFPDVSKTSDMQITYNWRLSFI